METVTLTLENYENMKSRLRQYETSQKTLSQVASEHDLMARALLEILKHGDINLHPHRRESTVESICNDHCIYIKRDDKTRRDYLIIDIVPEKVKTTAGGVLWEDVNSDSSKK